MRTSPLRKITTGAALYSVILVCSAIYAFKRPVEANWDALAYMDLASLSEGHSSRSAHSAAYLAIKGTDLSVLSSDTQIHRSLAASTIVFDDSLPFYSIRPGYIFLIRLANRSGLDLFSATRLVSSLAYIGIGFLLYFWCLGYTGRLPSFLWAATVMLSGAALSLARLVTPDGVSTLLILGGVYLAVEKQALLPASLLLLASLFVRTDDVLIVLAILMWLTFRRHLRPYQGAALALVACAVVGILNKFSGNYGWTVLFNNSFVKYVAEPSADTARVSAWEYATVALHNAHMLDKSYLPFVLPMGVAAILAKPRHRVCTALVLVGIATMVHFVLYPSAELRDYAPVTLISLLAAFCVFWPKKEAESALP